MKTGKTTDLGPLNKQQREAVTGEEKRMLVLAGAGSGKTRTLLQKLIYLVEEKEISPSAILAVTFTRNATNEMVDRLILSADTTGEYEKFMAGKSGSRKEMEKERLRRVRMYKWIDGLTIRTFHGFCYQVLRNHGVNEFDNKFRIIGDEKRNEEEDLSQRVAPETVFEVFHKLLVEQCGDTGYLLKLKRYVLDYIVDKIHLKSNGPGSIPRDGKRFTTLNGARVRSKSEQYIADWLYRHRIRFEYEPVLRVKDFDFHPDFFIPDADLYIEHVSNLSYPTKDKEEQFRKGKLLMVKTYEQMTLDSTLFNHTLEKIVRNRLPDGIPLRTPLTFGEEFNGYHEEVRDFVQQVIRITDMVKVENVPVGKVLQRAAGDPHERIRHFYELAAPLIEQYQCYCIDKSYLDFNDLILRSLALFRKQPDIAGVYRNRFRYILVDEFQDVNNLQVELIRLLLTDETQLFCVGDDWQSIYGFRGSNVNYIIDFEKHFPRASVMKLSLNYRSTQHIVGASNEVIRHNKFRIEKEMRAARRSEHKIVIYPGGSEEENVRFCVNKVRELLEEGVAGEDILFLYRRSKMIKPYSDRFREEGIRVAAKTIHAAKGLEARVVFIVGLTEGNGGFPDIWLEDRIFQVIKRANHDLLVEEERRLFYVAITRAREKLFLITEKGNESSFLKEIPEIFTVKNADPLKPVVDSILLCPACFSQMERLWKHCPYCGKKIIKTSKSRRYT
ncbi:MAG TPA: UvrD-helicase domain-containing protein [Bacteroidales bacterium]|nr:UvrD-helicase domain-containing protein [Bacteroidales bacterium]